jgi:hypothetical protein
LGYFILVSLIVVFLYLLFNVSKKPPVAEAAQAVEAEASVPGDTIGLSGLDEIDSALATNSAVEFLIEVASAEAPGQSGVPPEAIRGMVVEIARTVFVSVAVESLARISMKSLTALVTKHGLSKAAAKSGAKLGVLLLADALYKCLATETYGEQRSANTCADQGYLVASALTSPTSLRELAIRGRGLVQRAAPPLAIRAAKSASRFAAKATSLVTRVSTKMGQRLGAKVAAATARFSARMAAVAVRISARVAAHAAVSTAAMTAQLALGPVGIALICLELIFMVVSLALDSLCVGNYGEDCHVTADELKQLNDDQTQMMVSAMETSELVDLVLEVNTDGWTGYAEARSYMRGAYMSKNRAGVSRIFGTETVADWFVGLRESETTPTDALQLITDFKRFVDERNDTAIYDAAVRVPCKAKGGTMLGSVCAANKETCFAYIDSVESLVGPKGAAFSSAAKFATVQLSVLFTSSIRLAVEAHASKNAPAAYDDKLIDSVGKCIRNVKGRIATFEDAIGAMRAVDPAVAGEIAQCLDSSDWTVVDDSFGARAKWAHESAHVRRESFRWVERVQNALKYTTPSEARASANKEGICVRDAAAAMNLHVCPYIVSSTKKSGDLKYVVDPQVPAHAVNWKTGACTRTSRYCTEYDMQYREEDMSTAGETLRGDAADPCSESDDRRAVCTCGKAGYQKFGAFFVGDTIAGAGKKYLDAAYDFADVL